MSDNTSLPNVPTENEPTPMKGKPIWPAIASAASLVIAVGGAFFALMTASVSQARGATRSCQLQWEQRQKEIEAVVRATDAAEVRETEPAAFIVNRPSHE